MNLHVVIRDFLGDDFVDAERDGGARFAVLDDDDNLVGLVSEVREWTGLTYGPSTYSVNAHSEASNGWMSEGHPTLRSAMASLDAHLSVP